ncbi:MAG: 1-acyl-sn-glycerol-3-phosphate acyltransferase [Deltaproteobacteria bacterium]|nr:1-acyl-sn-glycerol-3-phosphate acyltransferase [Deltaproteobacteria bacterium]
MLILRSLLFYILHWPTTVILSALIVIVRPFGIRASYFFGRLWSRLSGVYLRLLCGISYEVIGGENIPAGPAVYLAKHQSAWETVIFPSIFPPYMWVLKRELFYIPVFGWCLKVLGHIGIDREMGITSLKQINSEGARLLKEGFSIIIFPEGTRVAPGEVGEFNPGGVSLALKTGVPIVPVTHNAGLFWRRKEFAKRPGRITVVIDEPIPTEGLSPSARKDLNQKVRDIIEIRLKEIGG